MREAAALFAPPKMLVLGLIWGVTDVTASLN
jgi:hypothetical protein